MKSASIRSKLHEYIDKADETKLEAMYEILENDMKVQGNYTASDLALLYERRARHLEGSSKSFTVAESLEQIRTHRK